MKHANISLFVPHMGCPHQCSFCNQKTISGSVKSLTPDCVTETLRNAVKDKNEPLDTEVAFFGGSFTAIPRVYMISLLEASKPFIDAGYFNGVRISTRPDAIDEEVLGILKKYGVKSIELGAQSTDDEVLKFNKRGHTRQDIINASKLIKEKGFSLGLQMMTGLLGDTDEKTLKTSDDIISLKPDTVRIYPTVVLEGTELGELYKKGKYAPQTLENAVHICAVLLKKFHDNNIKVIRLGLHSGGNVEEGFIAGAYHPAFGELCESAIYLDILKNELKNSRNENEFTVFVNPSEISKMTGHKGCNKSELLKEGYIITVKGDESLSKYELKLKGRK
ncbi:MAG: radical SAM protein [Clostridia bacterium]|nr:radical SAM protein [Clostridia bacterium]